MADRIARKSYFIDRKVQGDLLTKAAFYWLLSLAVVGSLNVLGWIFVSPGVHVLVQIREQLPSLFGTMFVALLSSLIVLPVLLYDLTRHTNKFAGPVYRLQKSMQDVAEGKSIAAIEFRKGDYWAGLAESFNGVLARLEAAEARPCDDEAIEFDTVGAGSGL